jgi:hypothetical protein
VSFGEVVSHDVAHAVVNVATDHDADLLLLPEDDPDFEGSLLRGGIDWIRRHAPCDLATLSAGPVDDVAALRVVSGRGPYHPVKLGLADALAGVNDAQMHLEYRVGRHTTDPRADAIDAYHGQLRDVVGTTGEAVVTRPAGGDTFTSDLTLVTADDELDLAPSEPVLTVYPHDRHRPGRVRRLLERLTF